MDEIRKLVWNGALNVQIRVQSNLLIKNTAASDKANGGGETALNVRVLRDSYLTLYLPQILDRLQRYLILDTNDLVAKCWFECNGVPLAWTLPIGVMHDMVMEENTFKKNYVERKSAGQSLDNFIAVWSLKLCYNERRKLPKGVVPLMDGIDQIEHFWMHRWKQVCCILNGTAKQMMSLSRTDSQLFWGSILNRNLYDFESIRVKIIPRFQASMKHIPLQFHSHLDDISGTLSQPVVNLQNVQNHDVSLIDVIADQFPIIFDRKGKLTRILVCQGIQLHPQQKLYELYMSLLSFDGFLHICII